MIYALAVAWMWHNVAVVGQVGVLIFVDQEEHLRSGGHL